jgi:hypothetical protein
MHTLPSILHLIYFGLAFFVCGGGALVLILLAIAFFVFRRSTPPGAAGAVAKPSPGGPSPLAGALTHSPADWGVLTGLFNAISLNDKSLLLGEMEFLSRLVRSAGGVEAFVESFVYSMLEKRLADPTKKTPVLTKLAKLAGVDPQTLLNALEDRPAGPLVNATSGSVGGTAVGLLVLAVCLFSFPSGASAQTLVPTLIHAERFEPTPAAATIDMPVFAPTTRPTVNVAALIRPNVDLSATQPAGAYAPIYYTPTYYAPVYSSWSGGRRCLLPRRR